MHPVGAFAKKAAIDVSGAAPLPVPLSVSLSVSMSILIETQTDRQTKTSVSHLVVCIIVIGNNM